ncbi:hypothetical protein KEM52_002945 [Ascosphaera acerosa]|nr:hypothetical protein KEM52_002945 [Ascosphaera acerosa]
MLMIQRSNQQRQHDSRALIRRVDTVSLLLATNLRVARLTSANPASPFAHPANIAWPDGIAAKTTVTAADCLIDTNVTVQPRCVIKESVVGAGCVIGAGVRLSRCVLMENVVIEDRCSLMGCIVGRHARIGKASDLRECEVQDGNIVEAGAPAGTGAATEQAGQQPERVREQQPEQQPEPEQAQTQTRAQTAQVDVQAVSAPCHDGDNNRGQGEREGNHADTSQAGKPAERQEQQAADRPQENEELSGLAGHAPAPAE